jgi:hypothetical protein
MSSNETQVSAADQSELDYRLASAVAPHVMLRNLYLKAIFAEMKESRAETVAALASKEMLASVNWHTSHDFEESSLSLNVKLDFNVSVGQKPHIVMTCSYLIEYGLDSAPPSENRNELLQAFAKVNGVYNAWPYLRESLQTTCARMSVPPPLLPIFRVIKPSGKVSKNAVSTVEEPKPVAADR